jgi:PleD family two-component response regulator
LGRYGGEEFLIVLPDTDFENAKSLAERIRNNIKENLIATI